MRRIRQFISDWSIRLGRANQIGIYFFFTDGAHNLDAGYKAAIRDRLADECVRLWRMPKVDSLRLYHKPVQQTDDKLDGLGSYGAKVNLR